MNIFFLSMDPVTAAEMQCDKHVVKMPLELAQMLSTAHRVLDGNERANEKKLYKPFNPNHPMCQWVMKGCENYNWAWQHFRALLEQYKLRYGKEHASEKLRTATAFTPFKMRDIHFSLTDPPQCMPEQYRRTCTVCAYRAYYLGDKARFAKWNRGVAAPNWWYV